jgi:hypothetical protein
LRCALAFLFFFCSYFLLSHTNNYRVDTSIQIIYTYVLSIAPVITLIFKSNNQSVFICHQKSIFLINVVFFCFQFRQQILPLADFDWTWSQMLEKSLVACILACMLTTSMAFYLPGLAPKAFCKANKASETCKVCNHYFNQKTIITQIKLINFLNKSVHCWRFREQARLGGVRATIRIWTVTQILI